MCTYDISSSKFKSCLISEAICIPVSWRSFYQAVDTRVAELWGVPGSGGKLAGLYLSALHYGGGGGGWGARFEFALEINYLTLLGPGAENSYIYCKKSFPY